MRWDWRRMGLWGTEAILNLLVVGNWDVFSHGVVGWMASANSSSACTEKGRLWVVVASLDCW